MEQIVRVEMSEDFYNQLPENLREQMTLKSIEPKDFDYSKDEGWKELNKASSKAYRKRKTPRRPACKSNQQVCFA